MQSIKNIIFDYGNVIFQIDFKRAQQSFADLGIKNVEDFFSHSGHDPLFNEFEKGNITSDEFRSGIRKLVNQPELSSEAINQAWNSLLIGVPAGNHEVLLKAKTQYRTFLLSNNNPIHYDWIVNYLKKEFNTSNAVFFEQDYYSHLIGMRKPDRDIFEFILSKQDLNVAETLFIDDSPQHLKTATEMGLKTHLLTSNETLPEFLCGSGILKP
ncbi:MAG: HAD family hydrolase [Sphingobacteriaceae bacterium]